MDARILRMAMLRRRVATPLPAPTVAGQPRWGRRSREAFAERTRSPCLSDTGSSAPGLHPCIAMVPQQPAFQPVQHGIAVRASPSHPVDGSRLQLQRGLQRSYQPQPFLRAHGGSRRHREHVRTGHHCQPIDERRHLQQGRGTVRPQRRNASSRALRDRESRLGSTQLQAARSSGVTPCAFASR